MTEQTTNRLLHALLGALLGAFLGFFASWLLGHSILACVGIGTAAGALLAFIFGADVVARLLEIMN